MLNPTHTVMKNRRNPLLSLIVSSIVMSNNVFAATVYWDTNGATADSGNAGGTWDTGTTSNWNSAADGTATPGTFTNGDIAIFSAGADGTGGWTINVSGTVQPGGISFEENGTKNINDGSISVAANPTISSAGRNNGNNYNINSLLTGTGNLTLAANGDTTDGGGGVGGNITLGNSSNDFVGNVTITSGVVNFTDNGSFGNTANDIIIQGGGLVATGNRTLPSTRDIVLSGGGDKIFRAYGSATFTIDGAISGSGNVRHTDGGNLILNGVNTFTGNMENHRGNMTVVNTAHIGNINNFTGTLTLGNAAHTGNVSMHGGTLALNAGNTYTGFTHMRGSNMLRLDADNALPDGTAVVLWGGTTFNANGKTDTLGSLTTGSSSDTNVIVNLGTNGNLTVTNNNLPSGLTGGYSNATVAGKITGTGSITYAHASSGTALWDIMNGTNDFAGNWVINSGRLRFASDTAIGNTANDITLGGNVVNTMNNGGGSASMQVANGTALTHGIDRTFTLTTGKEGTFYVWGGTTQTINGVITGGGNLRKEDGGVLLLTNTSNNYTGETKIINGIVRLGDNNVLPNDTLVRIGGGGGTLDTNGKNDSILGLSSVQPSDNAVLTDGNVIGAGNLTIVGSGTYEFGGSYSPNSAGTLIMNGTGTQILSGTRDNGGGFATVNSGVLVLAKTSTASVHALGATEITALTIAGGTARLAGTGGDQIYDNSLVTINSGTFDINDRNEAFRGLTGSGGSVVNNGSGTATLTVGSTSTAGNTYSSASVIANGTGTLALTKTGLGTQNLNAANTYTGATTVSEGRLNVNGSLASGSAVSVAASSILGGDGTIHGNVSLAGTLLPGQGGTTDRSLLINGNVTSTSGSNIGFTIDSESSHNALNIGALGSIDLSNTMLMVTLNDTSFTELGAGMGGSYTSASYYELITGSTSGMFANVTETMTPYELSYFALSGTQYKTNINGQAFWVREGSISLVAIPEPTTFLISSLSLLGLVLRRKR